MTFGQMNHDFHALMDREADAAKMDCCLCAKSIEQNTRL